MTNNPAGIDQISSTQMTHPARTLRQVSRTRSGTSSSCCKTRPTRPGDAGIPTNSMYGQQNIQVLGYAIVRRMHFVITDLFKLLMHSRRKHHKNNI